MAAARSHPTERSSGPRFGLFYDMRNRADSGRTFEQLYSGVLEQVGWAEQLGYESVWLTEHHFSGDGYSPSPLPLATAIAARTSTMRIGTNVLLIPMYHPVRLAEDAALVQIISGGRFDLGVAMGYSEAEFAGLGVERRFRPSLMEESLEILNRAWRGEPFSYAGKRYTVPELTVAPVAARPPRLLIGATSKPGCLRAARLGDGFASGFNWSIPLYLEAMRQCGEDPDSAAISALQWIVVAEDPEREWARVGPRALHQINTYVGWGGFGGGAPFETPDALLEAGIYQLWDGQAAIAALSDLLKTYPQIEDVHHFALIGGEPLDQAAERIEYFRHTVVPGVRERLSRPSVVAR